MGIYVDVCSSKGQRIASGKYGVGYAILMFSRYEKTAKQFKYVATGAEAINNLNKYLSYIQGNMNMDNEAALFPIQNSLEATKSKIRKNETYVLDYSEIMGTINNPAFNPMYHVIEMADKIDDAIWGYSRFGRHDSMETKMMQCYMQTLSPHFNVSPCVSEHENAFVFNVSMHKNPDDEWKLETQLLDADDEASWQKDEYYKRRIFMIMKKSGLKFEWLSDGTKSAYIFIDKQYLSDWAKTKPFVFASYQLKSTYPIRYLLENNPESKENFYNYVMSQETYGVRSIIIEDVELLGMSEKEVSNIIGKTLERRSCSYNDVTMFSL